MTVGITLPMVFKGTGMFSEAPDLMSRAGLVVMAGVAVLLAGVVVYADVPTRNPPCRAKCSGWRRPGAGNSTRRKLYRHNVGFGVRRPGGSAPVPVCRRDAVLSVPRRRAAVRRRGL